MLFVKFITTCPCVIVVMIWKATLLPCVDQNQNVMTWNCLSITFEITSLFLILLVEIQHQNPCVPSPCGPNSYCRAANGVATCSCLPDMLGTPPSCRPECITDSECPSSKACVNRKCQDPCPGSCGYQALCHVINHNPLCTCRSGYTGSPFVECQPIISMICLSCKFRSEILTCNLNSSTPTRYYTTKSLYTFTVRSLFSM